VSEKRIIDLRLLVPASGRTVVDLLLPKLQARWEIKDDVAQEIRYEWRDVPIVDENSQQPTDQ
jgi:hypothetical protein